MIFHEMTQLLIKSTTTEAQSELRHALMQPFLGKKCVTYNRHSKEDNTIVHTVHDIICIWLSQDLM